ncbi:MAG TPA: chemotaxis protein CheB [Thermoanaerobaculia bacterium]|nr:chemotaxis protein CheB [Thermoanaerobaculia bacterium]
MRHRDILVIGASAGGVSALSRLVSLFPPDLRAAVFVVIHVSPHGTSAMPAILSRSGPLRAVHPQDREPIIPGTIYVAPPDHHLVIESNVVRVSRGPTENAHRPSVDVLFRTAAQSCGNRVVGVVLTGNLDDGTAGLAAIKRHGGKAVVQDPGEADYPSMPRSAMRAVAVDHVLTIDRIGPLLAALAHEVVEEPGQDQEVKDMKNKLEWGDDRGGRETPSGLACPECGGSLFERTDLELLHFRCRIGHAYSPESLLAEQEQSLEATLWAAVRALEENAALSRRMEKSMSQSSRAGAVAAETRYGKRAEEAERHADALRRVLMKETARTG